MAISPTAPADAEVSVEQLTDKARYARKLIVDMTTAAGSGHPSSSFSCTEILVALYCGGILRVDPRNPHWPDRDRFILSKGHAVPAQYALMAMLGFFPEEDLQTLRQINSPYEGHPNTRRLAGIEASTGSLGQGLSIGLGIALAATLDKKDYTTWVVLGDGECDEGQVWEAAMAAAKYKTDNLVAIVDRNGYQQTGSTHDVMPLDNLPAKWESFGWHVHEIDGHSFEELLPALRHAQEFKGKPSAIVANTKKGKGVSFVEADYGYHGKALTKEERERALEELGWK